MSLTILKKGILDSVQDQGRYGYQQTGINPGGVMDRFSAQLANALLGNDLDTPVLELHFPAAQLVIGSDTIICLAGGDFSASLNHHPIPLCHPVAVKAGSILSFDHLKWGARTYISFYQGLKIVPWLDSCSTNFTASVGGFNGRALQKGDVIQLNKHVELNIFFQDKDFYLFPWSVTPNQPDLIEIECILGNEWHWISKTDRVEWQSRTYSVTHEANRMGYRLQGEPIELIEKEELVSSAVNFGTVQVLPDGQLVILMADHQTTGGYPRAVHIISTDISHLAQVKPNEFIRFKLTDLELAEQKLISQQQYLWKIKHECDLKMKNQLHANRH